MSPEKSHFIKEQILAESPFLKELRLGALWGYEERVPEGFRKNFKALLAQAMQSGGFTNLADLENYVRQNIESGVKQGLWESAAHPERKELAVIVPTLVGYELGDRKKIGLFLQDVTMKVNQFAGLYGDHDGYKRAFKWVFNLMQQGGTWKMQEDKKGSLKVFKEFIGGLPSIDDL